KHSHVLRNLWDQSVQRQQRHLKLEVKNIHRTDFLLKSVKSNTPNVQSSILLQGKIDIEDDEVGTVCFLSGPLTQLRMKTYDPLIR
ncbi:hypothetical protein ACJMK2_009593, partial [Sinanodonta woodiana]